MNDDLPPEDQLDITETPDGGAEVLMSDLSDDTSSSVEFSENLALGLKDGQRRGLAADYIELIEKDKKAREKRDQQYEEGLRRTGLGDDAPGGAQFQGASRVVHPMLAESCVDFEARAIKELFPAGGPVRTMISGDLDEDKLKIAEIKRDVLNYQLTRGIPEYRDELESLLSQLPLGGSQYLKLWHDGRRKRTEFVPIDHVYLPFAATNFYTAQRATHAQLITKQTFAERVRSGLYDAPEGVDITEEVSERSKSEIANDKIEGRDDSEAYNDDGLRTVYEVYTWLEEETDSIAAGEIAPYILHIDAYTEQLLGMYRNWAEGDDTFEKLDWIVEWGFIPWRGAYKIGLPHLIGGLSGAATGALRALLDSAHAANAPTLLKLKAGRMVGQTTEVAITQVQEIEGPAGVNDIRQLVSPVPFAGPNPVLFQLLGFLIDQGKGVVATAEEKIADASNTMPVGTSLALIEQGSKVFSAIHQRLHNSQAKVLEILCRLNATYPEIEEWQEALDAPIDPTIFWKTADIAPVSDPNIFSEAQRFSQMQAVMQLAQDPTVPYNKLELHQRMLRLINVPNPEQILPAPTKPKRTDAVQENMILVQGMPAKAYPDQDHLAHIEVHLRFILNPALGGGPAFQGPQLATILGHCAEHLVMFYPQTVEHGKAQALATGKLDMNSSPEAAHAVGAAMADANAQQMQVLMQMWAQAQQLVGKKMPPPQFDPQAQVTLQVAQMEDARGKMELQAKTQLEQSKLRAETEFKQAKLQADTQLSQMEMAAKERQLQLEQQFAVFAEQMGSRIDLMKNDADNQQHQMTELLKNRDDNQTAVLIEQIKQSVKEMLPAEPSAQQQDTLQPAVTEMQRLLGEIEKAKTSDALTAVIQGLQATISAINAPRVTQLHLDQNGRPIGSTSSIQTGGV